MLDTILKCTGVLAVVSGGCVVVDSLAVDLVENENPLANTVGVAGTVFAVVALGGIYLALRPRVGRSTLLDVGYLLNLVGLTLVVGVDFVRNYVFVQFSDGERDALLDHGPTLPAFLVASLVFVLGAVLFGVALARAGFVPVAAWAYVVSSLPSALVPVLPNWVSAGSQVVTGLAVVWMGRELLARSRAVGAELGSGARAVPGRPAAAAGRS